MAEAQHQQNPDMIHLPMAIHLTESLMHVGSYLSGLLTSHQFLRVFFNATKQARQTALRIEGDVSSNITACRQLSDEIRRLEAIVKNHIRCPHDGPYQEDINNTIAVLCQTNGELEIMSSAYLSMSTAKDDLLAGDVTHDECLQMLIALDENARDAACRIESDPGSHGCVIIKCRKLSEEIFQKELEVTNLIRPHPTLPIQETKS